MFCLGGWHGHKCWWKHKNHKQIVLHVPLSSVQPKYMTCSDRKLTLYSAIFCSAGRNTSKFSLPLSSVRRKTVGVPQGGRTHMMQGPRQSSVSPCHAACGGTWCHHRPPWHRHRQHHCRHPPWQWPQGRVGPPHPCARARIVHSVTRKTTFLEFHQVVRLFAQIMLTWLTRHR